MDQAEQTRPGRTPRWGLTAGVLLAVSVLPIAQATLVAPVMGPLADSFVGAANPSFLAQFILVAPTLAIILSAPLIGRIADRDRRNLVPVAALILFGISGVGCLVARWPAEFVAWRLLLGLSVAAILATTPIAIGQYFKGADRQHFVGMQSSAIGIAGAATPVLAGFIAVADWRNVFLPYMAAWLIAPLLVIMYRRSPVPPAAAGAQPDATAGAIDWPTLVPICARMFLLWLTLYLLTTQLAFHLRTMQIDSALAVGLGLGAASVAAAASSLLYARVKQRLGYEQVCAVAFLVTALGYVVIATTEGRLMLGAGLVLAGLGFGLNTPSLSDWLIESTDPRVRGRAFGWLTAAMYLGQFLSIFIYATLTTWAGIRGTFLVVAAVAGAIALKTFVRVRPVAREQPTPPEAPSIRRPRGSIGSLPR
jgi:MFS family permease